MCCRQQYALKMRFDTAVVLLPLLVVKISAEICKERHQAWYKSSDVTLKDDGSIEAFGYKYHPGTFWKEEDQDKYIGCPCIINKCIQLCHERPSDEIPGEEQLIEYPSYYFDEKPHTKRVVVKAEGKGWSSSDLFNEFFVIYDTIQVEDRFHDILETKKMSLDDLQHACFVYNEHDQTVTFYDIHDINRLSTMLMACLILSVVCIVILLIAYIVTNEWKNNQGKCILHLGYCQMIYFIAYTLVHVPSLINPGELHCLIIAYITDFAIMASLSWSSVLIFDAYWSLSTSDAGFATNNRIFCKYSVCAWSFPAVMTIATLLIQNYNESHDSFKIEMLESMCLIDSDYSTKFAATMTLYYGPQYVLLLINCGLCVQSLRIIMQMRLRSHTFSNFGEFRARNGMKAYKHIFGIFLILACDCIIQTICWVTTDITLGHVLLEGIICLDGVWLMIICVFLNHPVQSRLSQMINFYLRRGEGTATPTRNTSSVTSLDQHGSMEMETHTRREKCTAIIN